MRIEWGIDDGYAGGSRPHHVDVPDEELADCETQDEAERLVCDYIREEMEQMPTYWRREQIDGAWGGEDDHE